MLLAVSLTACFSPSPPRGLPCSADNECPDGQRCDVITKLCDGESLPGEASWVDDTEDDFAAGRYTDEVGIEPGGFVGPRGFFTGVLRTRGYTGKLVVDPATATFDAITSNPSTGSGFHREWRIAPGNNPPAGVGMIGMDDLTVAVEGEIELADPGEYRFQLLCDDMGFLDIARPGGDFERLVEDVFDLAPATVTFTVDTPGWYRVRGAFQDNQGLTQLNFQIDSPAVNGGFRAVTPEQMRVRADDLPGVAIDGFDDSNDLLYSGSSSSPSLDQTYGVDPFGIPIGFISYSVRSSGQLLIDVEGDYEFTIDSVQGHRMWLDNQKIADSFTPDAAATTTTELIHLTPGWHDLVVDVHKEGGDEAPRLSLTISAGPVTGEIAPDHLRPVVARSQRFASGGNANEVALTDGGASIRGVTVALPPNFVTEAIRFGIAVDHPDLAQVGIILDPPAGPNSDVVVTGALTGGGLVAFGGDLPLSSGGSAYSFTISDSLADTITGSVVDAGVTHLGASRGTPPFATSYRYESAVRDLGNVTEFLAMAWRMRQGDPAAAAMQVRTCDDEAACVAEPWTDVALGAVPQVSPRRFAQYGVTIATDGDVPTALDVVELRYVIE